MGLNCGPDLGVGRVAALNFIGSAGVAGDTWLAVYDETPKNTDQTIFTGIVSLSADVLIDRFNNKKGLGANSLACGRVSVLAKGGEGRWEEDEEDGRRHAGLRGPSRGVGLLALFNE